MHVQKKFAGQIIVTFLLAIIIMAVPFQDYMERVFLMDEIHYEEDLQPYVKESDAATLLIEDGQEMILLQTEELYLKKGNYKIVFNVIADTEENCADVYAPLYVKEDNTSGKTLVSGKIGTAGKNLHLEFAVEEYLECVQFRLHCNSAMEFQSIYLLSETGIYCDPYIYIGILLAGSALFYIYRRKHEVSKKAMLLLSAAALWSCMPLGYSWLYEGHDMYYHYGRLIALSDSIQTSALPVRMHSQMFRGFGYMSPVFYPELFLYPFAVLEMLGMSPVGCYKLLMICINFGTAAVSYYSFSNLLESKKQGLTGAVIYTLSMYRLINIYTRAAVGESLAMVFLPLWILGIYQLWIGDYRKWYISTLAFTALFQTHLITTELAVLFAVLLVVCSIWKIKEKKRLLHVCYAGVFALLLNIWYLIPMLDHMQYSVHVLNDTRQLEAYAVYVNQLFDLGFNGAASCAEGKNTTTPEMSYTIGIVYVIGVFIYLWACFHDRIDQKRKRMGNCCLIIGGLALYMSSTWFPWEILQRVAIINSLIGNIQFAFRFLPVATVLLCITAAIGIDSMFSHLEQKQLLVGSVIVVAVCTSGTYFSNYMNQSKIYATKENQLDFAYETDINYLIDNNGNYISARRLLKRDIVFEASEGVELSNCYREDTEAGFTYHAQENSDNRYVDVSLNQYPYYRAYDASGNKLQTGSNEMLYLRVFLPEEESGDIRISLEFPVLYRYFDALSEVSLLVFIIMIVKNKKNQQKI